MPTGQKPPDDLADRIAALSPAKRALLELRLKQTAAGAAQAIPPSVNRDAVPLSFAQQRLWFLDQLEPNSFLYNISKAVRLRGQLHVDVLEETLDAIVARHEALRTVFVSVDGSPVQVISATRSVKLARLDLAQLPEADREAEMQRVLNEELHRPFNLSRDVMLRATLLRLGENDHVLNLVMHHIASDGWSMAILFRELSILYEAFSRGRPSPLPDLPVQYADFAVWQRGYVQGEVLESLLGYWKKQLAGIPPRLELGFGRYRQGRRAHEGATQSFVLSSELSKALNSLSRREGATLYMTLLSAFQALLYRYSGQQDLAVGSPIAGRNRPEIEGLIGFFVNTLVLRTDLSGNLTFRELLKRVRNVTLEALTHQDAPFERLVEELQPDRSLSHTPLFQVMFALQNAPRSNLALPNLDLTFLPAEGGLAKFDLTLSMIEDGVGLRGSFRYNAQLFDRAAIGRMVGHFQTFLEAVVADPDQPVSELPLLTEAERHQLLVEWNDTRMDYPRDKCIHQLFEAQVERTPEATAVRFEDQQLTYSRLNARANQLAAYLRKVGVGPEVLVGICMDRSLEMLVGLLGILKAGGSYVPLDPAYPKERLAFMLEDTGASVVLTHSDVLEQVPEDPFEDPASKTPHRTLLCLDTAWEAIARESEENPASDARSRNLAYVIYTSGTTGRPKGVMIEHSSLVGYLSWVNHTLLADGLESVPAVTRLSFDASLKQLLAPLLRGGAVLLVSDEIVTQPAALMQALGERAGGVNCAPSLWTAMLDAIASGQSTAPTRGFTCLLGGESLNEELVERSFAALPDLRIWNLYGPTEATANASAARIGSSDKVTIGHPIANTEIYLLDSRLQPVPIGVPGEVHIGGVGLARGYLNRPELTAERFIPNAFSDNPGARLYKTGDLARYLPDGSIEFLGRTDHQVKIRGFRVELEEIETVLVQHPSVQAAVVVAREDPAGDHRIVAYIMGRRAETSSPNALRDFLVEKLPDFMVPSIFVFLDSLPLTPSGKVDRRALPAPERNRLDLEQSFVAPRNRIEQKLTAIWADVLGIDQVGIHDNFFELGGHSLLAIRLFARIEKEFNKRPPLSSLFERATIEHLAKTIAQPTSSVGSSSLVAIQPKGFKRPFFCVHEFFGDVFCYLNLAHQLGDDQPFYALQARGLNGADEPFTDIESMAAYYVKEIKTVQPDGPYALGGLCIGGVVAFEMARQLRHQGDAVALVALLDSGVNSKRGKAAWWWSFLSNLPSDLPSWLIGSLQLNRSQWSHLIKMKIEKAKSKLAVSSRPAEGSTNVIEQLGDLFGFSEQHRKVARAQHQALRQYRPQVYPGRLTLFRARMQPFFSSHAPDKGWQRLAAGGLDIRTVPGNHLGMLQEPHVKVLAEQLTACLDEARVKMHSPA